MRNMLVVGQMALSLTLVTAAGLFIKGALGAANADPGFRLEREALASVDASLAGYDEARGRAAYRSVMTRLRAAPAVEAASLASSVPFGEFSDSRTVRALGRRRDEVEHTSFTLIGADYFATLGLRLLRGREFSQVEEERPSAVRPVVVNATLARRLWADENPIGQRLQVQDDAGAWGDPMEVVGVAPGLRGSLFDREAYQHLYVPFGGQYQAGMNLHVRGRSEGDAAERVLLHALHGEIRAADACLPVLGVKSLREHRDTSIFVWIARSGADMFSTFGIAALLLAVIGLYGVKAYMVSRRTREIGIRMALGAAPRDVLSLIMREGFALTMMGLGIGLALSALIAPLLSSWVYGVAAFEPVVFASAPLVLAAAALAACYLPARRATRVAPVTALRCD
jgi:predicted permease